MKLHGEVEGRECHRNRLLTKTRKIVITSLNAPGLRSIDVYEIFRSSASKNQQGKPGCHKHEEKATFHDT